MRRFRRAVALTAAALLVPAAAVAAPSPPDGGEITLRALGTYDGFVDQDENAEGYAEIVAFDPASDRMFISNDVQQRLDIVSIADPTNPTLVTSVDVTPYGTGINGVYSRGGLVAVAVEREATFAADGTPNARTGRVLLLNADGEPIIAPEVGVLPDMVTISPDGLTVVVANEGEPICAADSDDPADAVDPPGTITVVDLSAGFADAVVHQLDFSGFDTAALRAAGVRIFFPGSDAGRDLEPEYVVVSDDSSTAYVTLQEANAIAVVDLDEPTITAVVPLGLKAFRDLQMDPSNRDAGAVFANWDVFGMYMPDAIDTFTVGGQAYLATANEGDARDYDCYSEEERLADLDYTGATIPDTLVAAAQDDALLGRLNSTTASPTGTPIGSLHMYGARSFTIWDAAGGLVWDSGDDFAAIVAARYPDHLNGQSGDGSTFAEKMANFEADARSDDKGGEPEAVAVGQVGSRHYAFVGLERQGGIMIYDVSSPAAPQFQDYVNLALDETIAGGPHTAPGTYDISPEGVTFVPASDSPNGQALVLVANELSGTTTVYQVVGR